MVQDDEEGEILKMAIAMSLEKETGVITKVWSKITKWFPGETQGENLDQNDDEEEMLKIAIAMSLEEQ